MRIFNAEEFDVCTVLRLQQLYIDRSFFKDAVSETQREDSYVFCIC